MKTKISNEFAAFEREIAKKTGYQTVLNFATIARLTVLGSLERWQSGRMHRTRNPAYVYDVSRVQIPVFPPTCNSTIIWQRSKVV